MAVAQNLVYKTIVGTAGDETTLVAGEAAMGGSAVMYVKAETYTESPTFNDNYVEIYLEPGTTVVGDITLSGDGVYLHLGVGCDIQGTLTVSGAGCSVICQNGCDLDDMTVSGDQFFIDGGGFDTIFSKNITISTVDDCIFKNFTSDTKTGASGDHGFNFTGTCLRINIININFIGADLRAIFQNGSAFSTDLLIMGCTCQGSDREFIYSIGPRTRIIGNRSVGAGAVSSDPTLLLGATADDSIVFGNVFNNQQAGIDSITVHADSENCVLVGNRIDDLGTANGIADSSGTSTVGLNNETAF